MEQTVITQVFGIIANFLGGPEVAGIILLLIIGLLAYLNRASLPTVFFAIFLLCGSLSANFGGLFLVLFSICALVGGALIFLAGKQQFSQL